MLTVEAYSTGEPGVFGLSSDAPMYHTELLSHELRVMLYSAYSQGVSVNVLETSDLSTFDADWSAWGVDMKSYIDSLDAADETQTDIEAMLVPAIPAIGAIAVWLAKGAAAYFLVKVVTTVIDVAMHYIKKRLTTGGTLMSLEAILKKALLRKDSQLNENVSIITDIFDVAASLDLLLDIPYLKIWAKSAIIQDGQ